MDPDNLVPQGAAGCDVRVSHLGGAPQVHVGFDSKGVNHIVAPLGGDGEFPVELGPSEDHPLFDAAAVGGEPSPRVADIRDARDIVPSGQLRLGAEMPRRRAVPPADPPGGDPPVVELTRGKVAYLDTRRFAF